MSTMENYCLKSNQKFGLCVQITISKIWAWALASFSFIISSISSCFMPFVSSISSSAPIRTLCKQYRRTNQQINTTGIWDLFSICRKWQLLLMQARIKQMINYRHQLVTCQHVNQMEQSCKQPVKSHSYCTANNDV